MLKKRCFEFLVLILCLQGPLALAQVRGPRKVNPLLKCLGEEEKRIYQRHLIGPIYKLNQIFVNEFILANNMQIKTEVLNRVCNYNQFSPSVALMRALLLEKDTIFIKRIQVDTQSSHNYEEVVIDELVESVPGIFIDFLSMLQGTTPLAKCLETELPEIKAFLERFKYLESEVGQSYLVKERQQVDKIFSSLMQFDKVYAECEKKALILKEEANNPPSDKPVEPEKAKKVEVKEVVKPKSNVKKKI